ncbi:MAG: winged helix-turn-helix domain-containing protein [Gammaproteobacteria bacterium]|nr:winged helix-turn-helix domain-containing protein [Gammaproteobacteria bacterium]
MSQSSVKNSTIQVGRWTADLDSGLLIDGEQEVWLEPTPLLLLKALAAQPGQVVAKEILMEQVWPNRVIGEDALSQTIFRLRKALGDNPKQPEFIETIPRKGYRLTMEVNVYEPKQPPSNVKKLGSLLATCLVIFIAVLYFAWPNQNTLNKPQPEKVAATGSKSEHLSESFAEKLTKQADDFYAQYNRADNEAAIELYQRAIAAEPDFAPSQSGLANALIQKVLRWPNKLDEKPIQHNNLLEAIQEGRTETESAIVILQRAEQLAQRAVRLDPGNATSRRALGFAYATQSKFDLAQHEYEKAIQLDPNAWGAMINLSEIYQVKSQPLKSIEVLEQAFEAMSRVYEQQSARIKPWQPGIGNLIGERYLAQNKTNEAEIWFRRVLGIAPYHQEATSNLIRLMLKSDDVSNARSLCSDYQSKIGNLDVCKQM